MIDLFDFDSFDGSDFSDDDVSLDLSEFHLASESSIEMGMPDELGFDLVNDVDDIVEPYSHSEELTFTGNYYDDQIASARSEFDGQIEQAAVSRTSDEMKFHIDKAENARQSEHFWKDCKAESEIEQRKTEIQREFSQKQLDIENKLQEDIENIFQKNRK